MPSNPLDNQYTEQSPCIGCERERKDKKECALTCKKLAEYRNKGLFYPEKEGDMNINNLRAFLVEELTSLREGKSTPEIANAIVNVSGKILSTVKLEMEYRKMIGKETLGIDFIEIDEKKLLAEK